MKSKKGIGQSNIIQLILILAMSVIFLGNAPYASEVIDAVGGTQSCQLSVKVSSFDTQRGFSFMDVHFFSSPDFNPFKIQCEKRYIKIKEDKIDGSGISIKFGDDNREDRIKEFVLDEMSRCWNTFAVDNVDTAKTSEGERTYAEKGVCFVCSEVILTNDFVEKQTQLTDFYGFANENKKLTGESYVEYLTQGTDVTAVPEKDLQLSSHQQWSVIFTMHEVTKRLMSPSTELKLNSGIVDCNLVIQEGTDLKLSPIDGFINCASAKNDLIFGRVAPGNDKNDFFSFKDFINPKTAASFPMTVRFVPTQRVPEICGRIY